MDSEYNSFLRGLNIKNESAWRDLFKSYYAPLCNHASRILTDSVVVEDIVQEVFTNLWSGNASFTTQAALNGYLYRSVTNNALKHLRNQGSELRKMTRWSYSNYEMSIDEFSSVVHEEVLRKLHKIIDCLPPDRRKIILMSLNGMNGEEIASELKITIHTVKQQKYRAYKLIKDKLGGDFATMLLMFI